MKRLIVGLAAAALAGFAAGPAAQASWPKHLPTSHGALTLRVGHARRAVIRYERGYDGQVGRCRRLGPRRVTCAVSESVSDGAWAGWALRAFDIAWLAPSGRVRVWMPGFSS